MLAILPPPPLLSQSRHDRDIRKHECKSLSSHAIIHTTIYSSLAGPQRSHTSYIACNNLACIVQPPGTATREGHNQGMDLPAASLTELLHSDSMRPLLLRSGLGTGLRGLGAVGWCLPTSDAAFRNAFLETTAS